MFPEEGPQPSTCGAWLASLLDVTIQIPVVIHRARSRNCSGSLGASHRRLTPFLQQNEVRVKKIVVASVYKRLPLSLILYSGTENFEPQIIAAFTIRELSMRNTEKALTLAQSRATYQRTMFAGTGAPS
jgi:hypothetical protein